MAAIREALDLELAADPDVIVMGEDVGRVGGIFRATEGLFDRYGPERIRDTPLTESGFVGCELDGVALGGHGLRLAEEEELLLEEHDGVVVADRGREQALGGKARVAREGNDVTVVALGATVGHALRAARELEAEGIDVEVLDPRTLAPLDTEAIARSVAKTSRVVVAHEAVRFGGFGGEIASQIAEHCFWDLDGPVVRVGAPSHPMPYQKDLELATLPDAADIATARTAAARR